MGFKDGEYQRLAFRSFSDESLVIYLVGTTLVFVRIILASQR